MTFEILREHIFQQQPQWRDQTETPFVDLVAVYFNNWYCNLPGGSYRNFNEQILSTKRLRGNGREMTDRELFEQIDNILEKNGINIDQIRKLQEDMKQPDNIDALIELMAMTLPIYITLTEEGFTRHDLVA